MYRKRVFVIIFKYNQIMSTQDLFLRQNRISTSFCQIETVYRYFSSVLLYNPYLIIMEQRINQEMFSVTYVIRCLTVYNILTNHKSNQREVSLLTSRAQRQICVRSLCIMLDLFATVHIYIRLLYLPAMLRILPRD